MKLVMHTGPVQALPVHDADGDLVGFRIPWTQRMVFEVDEKERRLLKPGMVLRVREGCSPDQVELVVVST